MIDAMKGTELRLPAAAQGPPSRSADAIFRAEDAVTILSRKEHQTEHTFSNQRLSPGQARRGRARSELMRRSGAQ